MDEERIWEQKHFKNKLIMLNLQSKETWTVEDWVKVDRLLRSTKGDLLQTYIWHRFRKRFEKEVKLLTKNLLSKEAWTETDLRKVNSIMFHILVKHNIPQGFFERYRKEEKKLLMERLISKDKWTSTDWFEISKRRQFLKMALDGKLPEVGLNDTIQRFRKRYEIEKKSNEDAFENFFDPWRKSVIKENITRELSLKNLKPERGDQWFLDKVREAQERQRKDTSNGSNNPISAKTDGMVKVPDEIDDDPYTRRLYTKALQDGKETDHCIRINVVGNFAQGKTSLIRRLVGQSIDGVETTNGIDIDRYICKESHDGNIHCVKSNNDDDTSALRRLFMIASSIEPDEVENIGQSSEIDETIHENKVESAELVQSPIDFKINDEFLSFLYLIKTETREEVVQTEKELPVTFDIWDFGGQYIFYATHTMFHSRNAIYLLVMDLTLGMEHIILDEDFPAETGDRNMEYFIKFWMNSIHSFVGTQNGPEPHIILVGTHKDKIPGDGNTKQNCIEKYFEDVRMLFDNTEVIKHIHSKDFAVDNTSSEDNGIELLGKEIIKLGTEKAKEVKIPAKWIHLEESLQKRKSENIISFHEVKKIDAENIFPLDDEEQIKLFLKYHHSKGTLFYFDEEPVSEYVVINPQYLINAFKCIITSERFCKKDPNIRPLWSRLVKEARLENDLIDFQWRRNDDQHFMANRTVLLSLLKKHHIISEVTSFDEQCQKTEGLGWYIVPSLLKNRITKTKIDDFLQGKRQTIIRIALLFENSAILPTVCHRLFAAALGKWCVASFHNQILLFEDFAVFRLDMYQVGIIKMNLRDRVIELQVLGIGCSAYLGDSFRRFMEAIVNHEFRKFNTSEQHQPYRLSYRCNHKSHGIDGSELVELSLVRGKHNVPCPNLENHTIPIAEAKSEWFLEDKIRMNDIPNRIPSEKQLSKFSRSVGENWEILGIELGLSKVAIDLLNEDNQTAVMKRFEMLMEWRKQQADRATIDVLVEAVKKTPQVRIDWDIIRNIIDEMKEQ
ncbi:uncharacterized protein LOC123557942 isoform X2 [Mercenaria mercenaria]|nr:uncharacterized protein LOC123557942 isoform X2 [Mercenaria mercenaria]XP_053400308.1 uncharacterized protein LOC123557942 isoform X2 [Mercenaria mercenaria]XP_053400309.1 uncharacterized protein LOC123557942 isoform X2 [Mercenaria mercenaria]XP_053400310.1 uncharacterized protein LOC123557942 isoform X2 [Mercenaria mercenaria]